MNISSIPTIKEWFAALPTIYIVFIVVCSILVCIIFVLTGKLLWDVHYFVPDEYVQGDLYFIIMMPSLVSIVCLIGNIIPRSAAIMYAVGLVYLMLCLHLTIILIIRLFGTRKGMANWMVNNNKALQFNVRPYCCCCKCLPGTIPTPQKIRHLNYLVRQSPAARIFLQIIIIVFGVEGVPDGSVVIQVFNGLGIISTLLAVFVCHVIVTATRDMLTPYNMYIIFRCVDTSQMLFSFQKFILDMVIKIGGINGLSMASPTMVSRFWHNVAMTFELTIVCLILSRNVRPGKCAFFAEASVRNDKLRSVPLTDL